jgi:hypothetical protein
MTHYPVPIPEDLLDERVLPIQVVAKIVSQSPKKTLAEAKKGRYRPLAKPRGIRLVEFQRGSRDGLRQFSRHAKG